jgi:hypothetical protein
MEGNARTWKLKDVTAGIKRGITTEFLNTMT